MLHPFLVVSILLLFFCLVEEVQSFPQNFHHQQQQPRRHNTVFIQTTTPTPSTTKRCSGRRKEVFTSLFLLFENGKQNNNDRMIDMEIQQMEKEVIGSTNAKLDAKRVVNALLDSDSPTPGSSSTFGGIGGGDLVEEVETTNTNPKFIANTAPVWQLALAAAMSASTITFFVTQKNIILSSIVFVSLFVVAFNDPMEEDDTVWGSFARLLGRRTIQSVEFSKPRVKAVVKAAIATSNNGDDDERQRLINQMKNLQKENEMLKLENIKLRLWKTQRIQVDDHLGRYTLTELKDIARTNRMKVSGTKTELLMRLVENNIIQF